MQQNRQRHNKQQVDQGSAEVQTETQKPQNQKNNEKWSKACRPPVLAREHLNGSLIQTSAGNRFALEQTNDGLCERSNTLAPAIEKQQQRSSPEALLLVNSGLSFGSANFRKERLGRGWNRHSARQQSPSGDVVSIDRAS